MIGHAMRDFNLTRGTQEDAKYNTLDAQLGSNHIHRLVWPLVQAELHVQ